MDVVPLFHSVKGGLLKRYQHRVNILARISSESGNENRHSSQNEMRSLFDPTFLEQKGMMKMGSNVRVVTWLT